MQDTLLELLRLLSATTRILLEVIVIVGAATVTGLDEYEVE